MLRTMVGGGRLSDGGPRMLAFVLSHFLHPFRSLPLSDTEMQKHWTKPNKECDKKAPAAALAASFKHGKVGMMTR